MVVKVFAKSLALIALGALAVVVLETIQSRCESKKPPIGESRVSRLEFSEAVAGKTEAEVIAAVGSPSYINSYCVFGEVRWIYSRRTYGETGLMDGTFSVRFVDGVVKSVVFPCLVGDGEK